MGRLWLAAVSLADHHFQRHHAVIGTCNIADEATLPDCWRYGMMKKSGGARDGKTPA